MGRNNRANRAAKAKATLRNRARASRNDGGSDQPTYQAAAPGAYTAAEKATILWRLAAQRVGAGGGDDREWLRLLSNPRDPVDRAFEALVGEAIGLLYGNGWMPVELLRQGRLHGLSAGWARLLARAIASDHAGRRASTLDSAWLAQVASLELPVENGSAGWICRWRHAEQLHDDASLGLMLGGYVSLVRLRPLHPLMPTPGQSGGHPRPPVVSMRPGSAASPMLTRVRNLLAKAESSTFEAEASAYTAKAQELITRHALDTALLEEGSPSTRTPVETRVPIDPPYADAKSFLLQTVAETGRCRAFFMPDIQMSTVVGYPDDVEGVETLFTSLLVQAQHALNEAARSAPSGARTRSQSYRSAFLLAYTHRIGERLREAIAHTVDAMSRESGRDLLPVLADRSDDVEGYLSEQFGDLVTGTIRRGYDRAGWVGGTLAADQAHLAFGAVEGMDCG